jgi:NhaP-type Na+/H+ and K+/H+ antiporter
LRRPPIIGDKVNIGTAIFVVRQLDNREITVVGMKLPS